MAYVTAQRAFGGRMHDWFRKWWQERAQAFRAPAMQAADHAALRTNEQTAPVMLLAHDDVPPYPQHWTTARPGLRADAALRLEYPYGSAVRVGLRADAAAQLTNVAARYSWLQAASARTAELAPS